MTLTMDDIEAACVDLAADLLAPVEPTVDVRLGVESDWHPDHGDALSVAWDGSISASTQVFEFATIRLVARSAARHRAIELLYTARGLLLDSAGRGPVRSFRELAGPFPGRDGPAFVRWATIRAHCRARPL